MEAARDQARILMQGTEYGDAVLAARMAEELEQRLTEAAKEGRPLRVYGGFDPRTADLHIGHTVPIRKLRQFQELGHQVSFVVGTGTALIGDPSDKSGLRPLLGRQQALENGATYAEQAFRILDRGATSVRYNHEWLDSLTLQDLIRLGGRFSLQQFLARDNFRRRWDRGEPVWLHETFYPLLQGYDAFTLAADVQVGGTDQLFNIVTASRGVMSALGARPNVAVIVGILPGTDGSVKMSKSLGNHIPLRADAPRMYGLVMSIPDAAMRAFYELATPLASMEIDRALAGHPRDAKMRLAREIVTVYHSARAAQEAEQEFVRVHVERSTPDEVRRHALDLPASVVDVMTAAGLVSSRSEARRLIEQGGVRIDSVRVADAAAIVDRECLLSVGRRKFVRVART